LRRRGDMAYMTNKMTQRKRLSLAASAGAFVLAVNLVGCSRIAGVLPGAATGSSSADAEQSALAQPAISGSATSAPVSQDQAGNPAAGTAPTPAAAAGRAPSQAVAARIGSIVQTLSVVGRVVAPEEVPLSFSERLRVKNVLVKAGQSVDQGQTLIGGDATDIQQQLDAAKARLDNDAAQLQQAQAAAAAQQRAAQQAQADAIATAQANVSAARANLQRVQAGPAPADVQSAQNAVAAAQIAARKAQDDQAKVTGGPDDAQIRAAELELAKDQAAVAKAQAELAKIPGGLQPDDPTALQPMTPTAAAPPPAVAENITPAGASADPNGGDFRDIAVDPRHPGTVFVGTGGQGLWKTTDGGHNWTKVNTGTNGKALDTGGLWLVELDPSDSNVVYAAPGYGVGGLWKSNDGGVNWIPLFADKSAAVQELAVIPTPENISFDPADHLHFIASSHFAWGGKYKSTNGVGVLETNDGGNTWTIHDPVPNTGAEHEVALIDSRTWIETVSGGGIYRTTDAGVSWTKVSDVGAAESQSMINVNGMLYLPDPSGLLRSTDRGATWQTIGPGSRAVGSDGQFLFTQEPGTGGHALFYAPISNDSNWQQYSDQTMCVGSTCAGAEWMASDPANHLVYLSNAHAGVWKLQTTGSSVAPVAAASSVVVPNKGGAATSQADLIAARQQLQAAKDAVETARAKLQTLQGGPDQNAVESAQLASSSADMALRSAQEHLNQLQRGPDPTALASAQDGLRQAQAALDRARAGSTAAQTEGGTAGSDDYRQKLIDKDNADIAELKARLAASQIVAPFAATVVSVRVRPDDTWDETKPAITIAKPGNPIVRATVTAGDADKVTVGQTALLTIPGQPDTVAPVKGRVNSFTDNDNGTAKVAELDADWGGKPPKLGTVMTVGLVLQQKDGALIVPKKAVHSAGTRTFVELVDPRGSGRKSATVQVGIVAANDDEIVSGLAPGQLVFVGP
jgi:multidrug efflux pump subunit AcrA (membrane-fusion protein)